MPDKITVDGKEIDNPAKNSAIFVVHGIGQQKPSETAATLRSGFDDALAKIQEQQIKTGTRSLPGNFHIPPPYIRDGFWGDYADIKETFKEDWKKFGEGQKTFFEELWRQRTDSAFRVYRWAGWQCIRLLSPQVICDLGFLTWLLYLPYQVLAWFTLTLALFKKQRLLTGFMGDIRMYVDPQGATERAIVQRIDQRVAKAFMRIIGLDPDFKSLRVQDWNESSKRPVRFTRVVWVAHSLGSVISYNVLSDLFRKAEEIEEAHAKDPGTLKEEYWNVQYFRHCFCRLVTIGSPLDKVAYLYGEKAITPWTKASRDYFLDPKEEGKPGRWWVNYYSALDPVSGPLNSELLFGKTSPLNLHTLSSPLPGYAHVGYWTDVNVLRYVLSRTYGKSLLEDDTPYSWNWFAVFLVSIAFHAFLFALAAEIVLLLIARLQCDITSWVGALKLSLDWLSFWN